MSITLTDLVSKLKIPDHINSDDLIIVIEPQQELRVIVVHQLNKIGFNNVLHTSNAYEALTKMYTTPKVSTIICNMELPLMSGVDLLQELKESVDVKRPPFIMTINTPNKEHIMYVLENGVDEILVKPYTLNDIAPKIQSAFTKFYNRQNPERIYELAKDHFKKGDYDSSELIYKLLEENNPNSARPTVGIARCKLAQNRYEEALMLLDKAISRNPYYVHAFSLKGEILFNQDKLKEGLEYFTKSIELSPLNPVRYERTIDIMLKLQKYEEAINILNIAVKNELDFPPIYHDLAKLHYIQKNYKLAIKYVREALIYEPNNTTYLNLLAISHKESGDLEESLKIYNKALKIDPDNNTSLYNKATLLQYMGKTDEAIKILERIYSKEPDFQDVVSKLKELKALQSNKNKDNAA